MAISLSNNFPTNNAYSASLTPSSQKIAEGSNYISDVNAFASQYLPETQAKEISIYGNRSVSGFLKQLGAEVPFASDIIQWSEQGRLHVAQKGLGLAQNVDGDYELTGTGLKFRENQTLVLKDAVGAIDKVLVTKYVDADTLLVAPYADTVSVATTGITAFVYGSEFGKGTKGMNGSLEAETTLKQVSPIIIKDKYRVAGSEMAQIGWIEVATDAGSGYLWYLKSESDTRKRFEDYLETSMVEAIPAGGSSKALAAGYKGTQGLFYQIEKGGNIAAGTFADRSDIENIIKVLDKEGAIQENAMFLSRAKSFELDALLASFNNAWDGGASYGLFDNDQDMALNLGFKGFNLGYDFYKTDWKYLNDPTAAGAAGGVDGVIVPAGTTSVYDEVMGESVTLPFLHVKYRKSATEDRKYKSWVVGSAGGASNTDEDAMSVHFLSERALCVMGANNFVLLK